MSISYTAARTMSVSVRAPLIRLQHAFCSSTASCSSTAASAENGVTFERSDNICVIGVNRPHRRNAVDHTTAVALVDAFDRFERDDALRVAVLHGAGGNFCSGSDLSSVSEDSDKLVDVLKKYCTSHRRPMGPTAMQFSKPVIAAVNGYCVAGGLELALMCDLRCADKSAVFGVFNRRFGVPLMDGGTVRLPALIGGSRAADMILTGRSIDADTAFQWGLVNHLCHTGTAVGAAVKLARSIGRHPQLSMLADRRSMHNALYNSGQGLDDALQFELDNAWPALHDEGIRGARQFAVDGAGRHGKALPHSVLSTADGEA